MSEEKPRFRHIEISEEEIANELEKREGGRVAGRGDSPYTQEFYEEIYGIKKKNREDRE